MNAVFDWKGIHFPCFSMFGNNMKTSQQKLNSGQHRKHNFNKGKCFPFEKNRKTLSFSFITHIVLTCSNHGLSFRQQLGRNNNCIISILPHSHPAEPNKPQIKAKSLP
jgi:hypothetical protein